MSESIHPTEDELALQDDEAPGQSEPPCPCVLLLDTSASMEGAPIEALNQALRVLRDELLKDPVLTRRAEVAVLTFDSEIDLVQDFVSAEQFDPPELGAQGLTCLGGALLEVFGLLERRRLQREALGLPSCRPWVFLLTDGEPQAELDSVVESAVQRLRAEEARGHVSVVGIGMGKANLERLAEIVMRKPLRLQALKLAELFRWIAACLQAVAAAPPDEAVELPPPVDWAVPPPPEPPPRFVRRA